jgi:hypothetical protein
MYVQPFEGLLGPNTLPSTGTLSSGGTTSGDGSMPGELSSDTIARFVPPGLGGVLSQNPMQTAMFGPLPGLLQQLMQMLQQMLGYSEQGYGSGICSPYGNEQYFPNANGASNGDPHLSFNGNHWNSMTSQPDLLESNSLPGGFRISTQTTPPNGNGIAWNQSATVALNGGSTTVSLNDLGQASIVRNGQTLPIAAGQTLRLGSGASVTCNANGSLTVLAQNGSGGQIDTTLTAQGKGVNVGVNAQNVDLGGALVNGPEQPPIEWRAQPMPF